MLIAAKMNSRNLRGNLSWVEMWSEHAASDCNHTPLEVIAQRRNSRFIKSEIGTSLQRGLSKRYSLVRGAPMRLDELWRSFGEV